MEAIAPEAKQEPQDIKIAAVITIPMCGWNPHWGCHIEALRPFQIPTRMAYGAFWNQSMSNLLEECVKDGLDWVLTMDYDSMFSSKQLDRLIGEFGSDPSIDALAALQCKRGTDEVALLSAQGKEQLEVNGRPIKVDTAHFGLTLLRVEALKRMPMPWFVGVPNDHGSFSDLKRTDADIYFWNKWKRAGNTCYVDPMCSIGHLQPMVSQFNERFEPEHVHVSEWRAQGSKVVNQ